MRFCLKTFRLQQDLSQTELAEIFDVCRSTIANWESQAPPSWVALACQGVRASRILPHLSKPFDCSDLIHARRQFGMNQSAFAAKFGVTRATISRWENGVPPRWLPYAIAALAFKE